MERVIDVDAESSALEPGSIPPFAALRAFEAVGRLGGIRKAAVSLSINHAVVSRHVASLEKWVGKPLLTRRRGEAVLTPAGQRYHQRLQSVLRELSAATSEITCRSDSTRMRIWTNGGFAAKWLGPRLAHFSDRHPAVQVELRPSDEPPDLLNGEADVDIRYYGDDYSPQPDRRGLRHVELARPHIMAVAAPALANRIGPIRMAADLLGPPLLHEENDEQWRSWFAARGVRVEQRLGGPKLWHAHLAIAAAIDGRGVALASSFLVSEELQRGDLVVLPDPDAEGSEISLGVYVLAAREAQWDIAPLRQFRRWLLQSISPQ